MEFKCPKCRGRRIEEIMDNVIVASVISDIHENGDFDYGEQSNEDGSIIRYQCMDCGFIPDINGIYIDDPEDLVKWIKNLGTDAPIRIIVVIDKGMLTSVYSSVKDVSVSLFDTDLERCGDEKSSKAAKDKNNELADEIDDMYEVY